MKTRMTGLAEVTQFINTLPRGMKIAAMRAIAVYLNDALRKEPSQKFVSRAAAYGSVSTDGAPDGYFSWAQFRFVAVITKGFTQRYTRTHDIATGWRYKETNSQWDRVDLTNSIDGAEYVVGDGQSRHEEMVGWRKWRQDISDHLSAAIRDAQEKVNALIARRG